VLDDARFLPEVKAICLNPSARAHLSAASVWKIVIKFQLRKLQLPVSPDVLIHKECKRRNIQILPISESIIYNLLTLNWQHKDPFDRLIVAQAKTDDLTLITPDHAMQLYPVSTL